MSQILDSGQRRRFESGAVRDIHEGKGRCDLLPLSVVCPLMPKQDYANILYHLDQYVRTGHDEHLYKSLVIFAEARSWSIPTMILEVSKQYEDGALKYGEHNWEKGIPLHCYIDSAIRHFLKFVDGRDDEPHDRAFVWNILGAIWTQYEASDMIDISFSSTLQGNHESEGCDYDLESHEADDVLLSKSKLVEMIEQVIAEPNE